MRVSMIMAMDNAKLIGKGGGMPWDISTDLQYFKRVTMGKPMIMGRVTFDSLGRPLPGRPHIVVTRDPDWQFDGVEVAHSLEKAFTAASNHEGDEVMVIGGASLCAAAMKNTERLYLTVIDHLFADGDTWLNSFDWDDWTKVSADVRDETEAGGYKCTYYVLERKPA